MGASSSKTGLVGPEGLEPSGLHPSGDIPRATFTPGPWEVRTDHRWGHDRMVETWYVHTPGNRVGIAVQPSFSDDTNAKGNAHLIASAPRLLHVLARIADETDTVADFDGYYLRDVAREALAELGYDYAEIAQLGMARQVDGQPIPQVAIPEHAHTAKRAACEEQRQGARDALRATSDEAGTESAGQADETSYGAQWAAVLVTDAALAAGLHQLRASLDLSRDLIADLEDDGNLHAVAAAVYRAMVLASRDSDGTGGGDANAAPVPKDCQARPEGIAQ